MNDLPVKVSAQGQKDPQPVKSTISTNVEGNIPFLAIMYDYHVEIITASLTRLLSKQTIKPPEERETDQSDEVTLPQISSL